MQGAREGLIIGDKNGALYVSRLSAQSLISLVIENEQQKSTFFIHIITRFQLQLAFSFQLVS